MRVFEKSILINCSQEELFNFHCDSGNIKNITPPDVKVDILTKDLNVSEGKVLEIISTKFFIPSFWRVEISLIKKPCMIVDTALKSPFEFWRHTHKFSQKGNMCELKDSVEYQLPFGFLGKLIEPLILKELNNMFSYRQKITKKILEKGERD